MIFRRFYHDGLAAASYLVGCAATGEALVVDPLREAELYVRAATAEGLRITHVTETHIHADFVSGTRELAARTGATPYLSAEGGDDWSYGFAEEDGAILVGEGDRIAVGNIRLDVVHTPGHTPEHLTFLVTDTAGADEPMGAFTGDFVFVGDVGRPDLLERAAGVAGAMDEGARQLFRSLRRFRELPEHLQVWPGHGAGSACGKALGAVPQSTVGYEKRFNWAFGYHDEDAFVRAVLEGQPDAPRYFAEMKRLNRAGARVLGGHAVPSRLPDAQLADLLASREPVVDTRPTTDYARAHVPGTINLPLNRAFTTRAGSVLPYDRVLHLIVDGDRVDGAVRDLVGIGFDRVGGYFATDAIAAWAEEHGPLGSIAQISAEELAARLGSNAVSVIDVREPSEWRSGRLPDAPGSGAGRPLNIPLGRLEERLGEIPRDHRIVVHCRSGGRSMIAASLLAARGLRDVVNLEGGLEGWRNAGYAVEREAVPAT